MPRVRRRQRLLWETAPPLGHGWDIVPTCSVRAVDRFHRVLQSISHQSVWLGKEWSDSVPADLPCSSKAPCLLLLFLHAKWRCRLQAPCPFQEDKGPAQQFPTAVSSVSHVTLASTDKLARQVCQRWDSTYMWASGSEGKMMQLCTGMNGWGVTAGLVFVIFSSSYVLKESREQPGER